jgi:signal transduction histidine kinase
LTRRAESRWPGLAGDDRDRLATARQLARTPDPAAEVPLREALARERVPWVLRALQEALAATELVRQLATSSQPGRQELLDELPRELQLLRADAIEETIRGLLHEITPLIGRARQAAEDELSPESEVRRELDALYDVCGAIRRLAEATAVPEFVERDIADEITRVSRVESESTGCPVRARGTTPFVVTTDLGLLMLAFENVLRNAIEATARVASGGPETAAPVVVTWGRDDDGPWIAVIDRGPGLPAEVDILEVGASTKSGPSGFGLPTAREAMQSLGGNLLLRNNNGDPGVTAVLELTSKQ